MKHISRRDAKHVKNKRRKTALTEQEVARNMRAVEHAIAQQELSGLKVSEAAAEDMYRAARGEIDSEAVRRNIYRRLEKSMFRP